MSEIRKLRREAERICLGRAPYDDLPAIRDRLVELGEDVTPYTPIEPPVVGVWRKQMIASLPQRTAETTLSNFRPRRGQHTQLDLVKKYARGFDHAYSLGTNIALIGPCGTGKTMLGTALYREVMEHCLSHMPMELPNSPVTVKGNRAIVNRRPLFTTLSVMWRTLRDAQFGHIESSYEEAVRHFCSQRFLIIDEFGMVEDHKLVVSAVQEVLSRRYDDRKPTCIITNLSEEELHLLMGDRGHSRFFGECLSVCFDGEDQRGKD